MFRGFLFYFAAEDSRHYRSIALADDAETEIVAGKSGHVRAANSRAQTAEPRFPTAAAMNALDSGGRTAWICFRAWAIKFVIIETLLLNISVHVFDSERIRI